MKPSLLDYILRNRLPVTIFVAAASFIVTFFASRAERDGVGYTPDQPINYSHRLHAGEMQIDCQYCHVAVEKSRHAMVPAVATCMINVLSKVKCANNNLNISEPFYYCPNFKI